MHLTEAQETAFILQYDRLIWQVVHRFLGRRMTGFNNTEDLHSECVLVLLRHIRASETLEDLRRIPIRNMIYVMCQYVLGEQCVSYPRRTSNFREVMKHVPKRVEYSESEGSFCFKRDSIEDAETEIEFKRFVEELPEQDRKIIEMKCRNFRNREIAQALNVTDNTITRKLKHMRKLYEKHVA